MFPKSAAVALNLKRSLSRTALLFAGVTAFATAQVPEKPIRMIIPLTPSFRHRHRRAHHRQTHGRRVEAAGHRREPRGAGGQIGTQAVVRRMPWLYDPGAIGFARRQPAIYKSLPYDPLKDLVDVALLGVTPYVMVTQKDGPYRTLKLLIDEAKANPGAVPFASAGVGSSTHLSAEYFAQVAGVKMLHIPYKGSPEAIQDTIAGRTSFYMAPINTSIGQLKEGKLVALGVSTKRRADVLPEVPALAEQGLKDFDISLWFGMWAPAATPGAIVQKLNAQVTAILQNPEVREQFTKVGIGPVPMKPDEFAKFVRSEIASYQRIVKEANIQPQ
jgi:tripartite-type tricarboxylate transporter receptor subunit TctC